MDLPHDHPDHPGSSGHSCDVLACPACGSRLVQQVHARPCADGRWHVERRCPECEWRGARRWPLAAYRELDEHQTAARAALLRLLAAIERSHSEHPLRGGF